MSPYVELLHDWYQNGETTIEIIDEKLAEGIITQEEYDYIIA